MEIINTTLSLLFGLEMVLKLYGMRLKVYARDPFNVFDFTIVLVSFIEIGLSPPSFFGGSQSKRGFVSILRTLRLLRVFKLARCGRNCSPPRPLPVPLPLTLVS
jgi:hypothetical protein